MPDIFQAAVQHILDAEGRDKITDDLSDPGGLTKWGISLRAYPSLGKDGIRNLTEQDAITIYRRDYWTPLHCDELPPSTALMIFDCAVNQGQPIAAMILQRALKVQADGVIGPKTIEAAKAKDIQGLLQAVTTARILNYADNKNFPVYRNGWIARTVETLVNAIQLKP